MIKPEINKDNFLGQLYAGGENLWQSVSFHGIMENNLFMHILMDGCIVYFQTIPTNFQLFRKLKIQFYGLELFDFCIKKLEYYTFTIKL